MSIELRVLSQDWLVQRKGRTYLSAGYLELNLATGGGDQLRELLADAAEEAQAVVLGEGLEEVLDGGVAGAGLLGELGDDVGLVLGGQGRGRQDGGELGILLEEGAELGDGVGGGIEGGGLGGGRVLVIDAECVSYFPPRVPFPRFVNWSFRRGSKSAQLIAERPIPPKIPSCGRSTRVPEQWHRCHRGRRQPWGA